MAAKRETLNLSSPLNLAGRCLMSHKPNFEFVSTVLKVRLIKLTTFPPGLILSDKDGKALPATAQICPVNNIFHSLFKSVTVKINEVEIASTTSEHYAHVAYLAELTSMSLGAKVR